MQTSQQKLQTWGAGAALFEALTYIVGFVAVATWLKPENAEGWDAARKLAFALERQAAFQAVNLLVYVAFGLALVLLTTALHERFRTGNEDLMRVATPFGYIWAGLVIASGMLAIAGLRLSRKSALAWLGVLVGSCGVLTLLPPLRDLGTVFGLTQILWFAATGISLLRSGKGA